MGIKKTYTVDSIKSQETMEWLLKKHYAKRMCSISFSFGLFNNDKVLVGVITFGMPPSSTLSDSICGKNLSNKVIELNRLVINEGLPKNTLSFFVSKAINKINEERIIVSFADANMSHHGYIYQATNFLYTGVSSNTEKLIDKFGEEFHFRNIGHYQKNNKLNAKLIKRRCNEDDLDKVEIAKYLRKNKGEWTARMLDTEFGYKDTASHWFRTDAGFSFPRVDDWKRLKILLGFDSTFDEEMTKFEWTPCANDIIKKLELRKQTILPKHRYVYFKGSKSFKSRCKKNLRLAILPYPKGDNKRYNASYIPSTQYRMF